MWSALMFLKVHMAARLPWRMRKFKIHHLLKASALFFILYLIQYYTPNLLQRTHLIQAVTSSKGHETEQNSAGSLGHFVSSVQPLPGSESAAIHLVTYNLWGHYIFGNLQNYEERFDAFADCVKDYDIVLVQEIFLLRAGPLLFSKYAEALVRAMEARGFGQRSDLQGSQPTFFGQTSGVVIFSRVPVLSTKSEIFRDWGWIESTTNKGFEYVEVLLKGQKLHVYVFNVHLDARKADIRERQLLQVLRAIDKLPLSSFLVVGGDFNLDSPKASTSLSSEEYRQVCRILARRNIRVVFPERPVTIPKEQSNTDQIFVSSNVKIKSKKVVRFYTKAGKMVSDHYGLATRLEVLKR